MAETTQTNPLSPALLKKLEMLSSKNGSLYTKELVEQLPNLLKDLETKMMDAAAHRQANADFIAAVGADCRAVKDYMATLRPPEEKLIGVDPTTTPPSKGEWKKTTKEDKEAWLSRQRSEDSNLLALIKKQGTVYFVIEADKVAIEIAGERLANARIVLSLKAAQLNFLAG